MKNISYRLYCYKTYLELWFWSIEPFWFKILWMIFYFFSSSSSSFLFCFGNQNVSTNLVFGLRHWFPFSKMKIYLDWIYSIYILLGFFPVGEKNRIRSVFTFLSSKLKNIFQLILSLAILLKYIIFIHIQVFFYCNKYIKIYIDDNIQTKGYFFFSLLVLISHIINLVKPTVNWYQLIKIWRRIK